MCESNMKNVAIPIITFFSGVVIALAFSYWFLGVVTFESSLTNQKVSLSTLKLIDEGKLEEAKNMHENMACYYLKLPQRVTDSSVLSETVEYFRKQGRDIAKGCGAT